jgi:hypothetical protein
MNIKHILLSSLLIVGCEFPNSEPNRVTSVTPWYNLQADALDSNTCNKIENDHAVSALASKQFYRTLNANASSSTTNTFSCPILNNAIFSLLLFAASGGTEDAILDYLEYEDKSNAMGVLSYGSNIINPSSSIKLSKCFKGIKHYKYSNAFINFVNRCENYEIEAVDSLSTSTNRIEIFHSFNATIRFADIGITPTAREGYFINSSNYKDTIDIISIEGYFHSFEDERIKIVSLPIINDSVELVFFLPKAYDYIHLCRDSIFQLASKELASNNVSFNIPLTNLHSNASLNEYLPNTIQQTSFSIDSADFSNINGSGYIWLSNAFITTNIKFSETGISSSVTDTIIFKNKPNEPTTLWDNDYAIQAITVNKDPIDQEHLDTTCYPFTFLVRKANSKTVLFLAHVNFP